MKFHEAFFDELNKCGSLDPAAISNVWNAMDYGGMPGHGPTDWAMIWAKHGMNKLRPLVAMLKHRIKGK